MSAMIQPALLRNTRVERERRRTAPRTGHPLFRDIDCRTEDAEPTHALNVVAILFRAMSGLLLLLMVVQAGLGLTSTVEISYGVLFGEAIRLVIFAGLLWAAGDLARLFVKSHCDIRATRILVARLTSLASRQQALSPPVPTMAPEGRRESEYRE